MAVIKKDPGKGYKSTEFQAMVAYGLYTMLGKIGFGASPIDTNASFSSGVSTVSTV